MDLEAIRRVVGEEVDRALAGGTRKRRVVTEAMVAAARRRGAKEVEYPPGALVTPAARERAKDLGVALRETPGGSSSHGGHADLRRETVERVVAAVLDRLRRRPDPGRARAWGQAEPAREPRRGRPLVTAEAVRAAAAAGRPLAVPRGALVTPLALDEARRRGVRLDRV